MTKYNILGADVSMYQFSIFDCCNCLHSSCCGSSDPLPAIDQMVYYLFLENRLKNWFYVDSKYDEAVGELCLVTMDEYKKRWFETDQKEILKMEVGDVQRYVYDLIGEK